MPRGRPTRLARCRFGPGLVMTMAGTAAQRERRVSDTVSSAMSDVFIIWSGGIDSCTQAAMSVRVIWLVTSQEPAANGYRALAHPRYGHRGRQATAGGSSLLGVTS